MDTRAARIRLLVPELPHYDDLGPYIRRIDSNRWYTNFGPLVVELEARLASTLQGLNTVEVVSTANATLGLELSLAALGVPRGSLVLLPALTFAASATAAVRAGLAPVFCDVDPNTWTLTPSHARDAADERPISAVLAVSTFGASQDIDAWQAFRADTGIPIVVDAAGAFGNQAVGNSAVVFSMHATKVLGCGEGGFVATCDQSLAVSLRRATNFGLELASGLVDIPGTNAKLSEYQAAVALAALDQWPNRRRALVDIYRAYLEGLVRHCPDVRVQSRPADHAYAVLPVLLPEGTRADDAVVSLEAVGIESRRCYCPTLERHPAFSGFPVVGQLAVTDVLNERLISLPFHCRLSMDDVDRVCSALALITGV